MPTTAPSKTLVSKLCSQAWKPRYSFLDVLCLTLIFGGLAVYQISNYTRHVNEAVFHYTRHVNEAVFHSPFPNVRIAEAKSVPDSTAYKQRYDFTTDWFSANIPVWEKAMSPIKGRANLRYLEIGLYEGRSAIWMLENVLTDPSSQVTGIDPFIGPYKKRFDSNLERSGFSSKVQVIPAYSQLALRELPAEHFDVIYIDGSHAKEDVLEDAVLSWRLLKNGGLMIFDDYQWLGCGSGCSTDSPTDFPKASIDRFVECFDRRFEVVHNAYQLILRKVVGARQLVRNHEPVLALPQARSLGVG